MSSKVVEGKIVQEEKKIEVEEKKIEHEEEQIVDLEKTIKTADKARFAFIKKFAKHKFLYSLVAGTGVVLVWRGLWDISETIPGLESSVVALIVGLGIIWVLEKYSSL